MEVKISPEDEGVKAGTRRVYPENLMFEFADNPLNKLTNDLIKVLLLRDIRNNARLHSLADRAERREDADNIVKAIVKIGDILCVQSAVVANVLATISTRVGCIEDAVMTKDATTGAGGKKPLLVAVKAAKKKRKAAPKRKR